MTGRFCRRRRKHLIIEIKADTKQVSLQDCQCTSCYCMELVVDQGTDSSSIHGVSECYDYCFDHDGIWDNVEFEKRLASKASRKTGNQVRSKCRRKRLSKRIAKEKRATLKPREARRRELRKQTKLQERNAKQDLWECERNEMEQKRLRSSQSNMKIGGSTLYQELQERFETNILPSEELGVHDEAQYERLLEIALDGDDITPEDFELLLQLDSKNKKATLKESDLDRFETLVVGQTSQEDLKSLSQCSTCLFCLEALEKLPCGTELRRLPCQHIFCKPCIDEWLQTNSTKCPNLACFWTDATDEEDEE